MMDIPKTELRKYINHEFNQFPNFVLIIFLVLTSSFQVVQSMNQLLRGVALQGTLGACYGVISQIRADWKFHTVPLIIL